MTDKTITQADAEAARNGLANALTAIYLNELVQRHLPFSCRSLDQLSCGGARLPHDKSLTAEIPPNARIWRKRGLASFSSSSASWKWCPGTVSW